MSTAGELISQASLKIGVASPTDAQNATALSSLNNMISFWGTDKLNFVVTSESVALTTASAEYTVGASGDLNTVRPIGIENCFLRDSDGYDYPVKVMSAKGYNRLSYKSYALRPTEVYFLPEFPLAKVIFNSIPDAVYTAYFEFTKNFVAFASTTTTVEASWPNEYLEALIYNLSVSLAEDWDRKISNTVLLHARETKESIMAMNAANKPVPTARFDFSIGSMPNITTGE